MTQMIEGAENVHKFFDELGADFTRIPFTEFLRDEMKNLADAHSYYFLSQAGPDGVAWQENAPSTIARKGHDNILHGHPSNNFRLSKSLSRKTADADAVREVIKVADTTYGVFGTNVPYSKHHEVIGGRLPLRRHLGVPESYLDRFADRTIDHAIRWLVSTRG